MKITESQLREAIETSSSMRQAAMKLPINFKTFVTYAKRFDLYKTNQSGKGTKKSKDKRSLELILNGTFIYSNSHRLKNRLIEELNWEHKCSSCGLSEWKGLPIPLELEHIDGNHYNNLKENLCFLCPNCHAQTPTYRNKKRN